MISPRAYAMGSAAVAYLIGGATAWYLTRKHYEKRIAEEVRVAMDIKNRSTKNPRVENPENEFIGRAVIVERERLLPEPEIVSAEFIVHSDRIIQTDDHSFFDYDKEIPLRNEDEPYVISRDEFELEKEEYDKISLEYYEEEDVILAETLQPMDDVDLLIGNENLKKFGYGSKDPRIVYVRNEHLETDWEIRIMQGSYVRDVLGYIEHSDKRVKTKFRREEE